MAWLSTNAPIIGTLERERERVRSAEDTWAQSAHTDTAVRSSAYERKGARLRAPTRRLLQTCPVICSRPPPRGTEGRLALLKSLMAHLWHPLWTHGQTKGHIKAEEVDFLFSPLRRALHLISSSPHSLLLLLLHFPQTGSQLGAGRDLLLCGTTLIPYCNYENQVMVFGTSAGSQRYGCYFGKSWFQTSWAALKPSCEPPGVLELWRWVTAPLHSLAQICP